MVTAPMLTTGLTVDLPDAPTDAISVSQQQPAVVSVKAGQQYFLRMGDDSDRALSLDAIRAELVRSQAANTQLMVLINGDQNVPYGDVVALMASLQQAGLRQVGLLTETPPVR
jgi:biopolymer transport protein TolR